MDADGDGYWPLFQVSDPFGTPSLTLVSDGLTRPTQSLHWTGGTLYGVQRIIAGSGSNSRLVTIDPATGAGTVVGLTGATGIRVNGIAVDTSTDTMYAINHYGRLASIDWQLTSHPDPLATDIGSLGWPKVRGGLDFYAPDLTLFAILSPDPPAGNPDRDAAVYTINTLTGQATMFLDLNPFNPGQRTYGFAPEPAQPQQPRRAASGRCRDC